MSEITAFIALRETLEQKIIGQSALVERLIIALLCDGHLLVEGPPGIAKTRAISTLSELITCKFQRIQFTPDMLPADITGTDIYNPEQHVFSFHPGPIFHELVLVDEINRAPAKVQSALLESMAERQVTIGQKSYPLGDIFLVMATQNPIEQEGTYALPEAQLDRFLMHVSVDYPDAEAERMILQLVRQEKLEKKPKVVKSIDKAAMRAARQEVMSLHMSEPVEDYILRLVLKTRDTTPSRNNLNGWIEFGASPRATIALDQCARAHAWLAGQDYVSPADVQAVVADVLRHRILLSYQAEAENIRSQQVIEHLLDQVPAP